MSAGPHRRRNLLTGDWVLVSPHRLDRPWQGETQAPPPVPPRFDPGCYLCPGNARAGGARNPAYEDTFVFENDYPALLPTSGTPAADPLFQAEAETGLCRVLCYGPEHDLPLAQMPPERVRRVIDLWADQYAELAARPDIAAVTIFENRGAMMGASNPHPHGQVWATASVPDELAREDARQRAYFEANGRPLLQDYLARERQEGVRVVAETEHALAVVPFWALWPYETLIAPKRSVPALPDLSGAERDSLAALLSTVLRAYDRAFETSAPYSLGWHQRPTQTPDAPHFTAHLHICPPLVRPPAVRKFMVGFEMFAMPQRDLTAETAAARLRAAALAG